MYSCGPLHMAEQRKVDQLELKYSNSVPIRDVVLKTYRKQWTIGRGGERGPGITVLMARLDDDDDDDDYLSAEVQSVYSSVSNQQAVREKKKEYTTKDKDKNQRKERKEIYKKLIERKEKEYILKTY